MRKMDFVLDFEAAASFTTKLDVTYSYGSPDYDLTQFVHKSGLLLVQITGDANSDFLLLPNRLASQRPAVSGKQSELKPVEEIVKDFRRFCRDDKALRSFWGEANKAQLHPPSPFSADLMDATDSDIPPMQLPTHLLHRMITRGVS